MCSFCQLYTFYSFIFYIIRHIYFVICFFFFVIFFFLMILRPPRSTLDRSSAASDVYKRQGNGQLLFDGMFVWVVRSDNCICIRCTGSCICNANDHYGDRVWGTLCNFPVVWKRFCCRKCAGIFL